MAIWSEVRGRGRKVRGSRAEATVATGVSQSSRRRTVVAGMLELIETRLFVEDRLCFFEDRARFFRRIADRREAEASRTSECAEHVKDDAGLADLAEVQPPAHDDVEEIVRREAAIARRFDMIARDEKFLASVGRSEGCTFRVVGPPVRNWRVRKG